MKHLCPKHQAQSILLQKGGWDCDFTGLPNFPAAAEHRTTCLPRRCVVPWLAGVAGWLICRHDLGLYFLEVSHCPAQPLLVAFAAFYISLLL